MIDGFKAKGINHDHRLLLANVDLSFTGRYDRETGEAFEFPLYSEHRGISFFITDNAKQRKKEEREGGKIQEYRIHVNMEGSFHKFYNQGEHNHNDFTFSDFVDVVIELYRSLQLDPFKINLSNVEFGVNVQTSFNPSDFLNTLIQYRTKPPQVTNDPNTHIVEFVQTQHIIKIYNKGLQYGLTRWILRFEVKFIKMYPLKDIGIKCVGDLLDIWKLKKMGECLVKYFNAILTHDGTVKITDLSKDEQLIIANGINPMYWHKLNPNSKDFPLKGDDKGYRELKNIYDSKLEEFMNLITMLGQNERQKEISGLIRGKLNQLLILDTETRGKLTEFSNLFNNVEKRQINPSYIGLIHHTPESTTGRYCQVTGVDITDQRGNSRFLSEGGVRKLHDEYPETFSALVYDFIPEDKRSLPLEKVCYYLAHNIRNVDSNRRNNLKRRVNRFRDVLTLYDPNSLLSLSDEDLMLIGAG